MAIGARRATIDLTADPKGLDRGLAGARAKMGAFGRVVGAGFKKVGGFLARAFDPLGRAWDLIAGAADEVLAFENSIARLAIAQGKSNEEMSEFRDQVVAVSSETGIARGEILKGVSAYQALTGDTEGAADAMKTFARVAQATGATTEDVATAAAALTQNLKIDPAQLETAFDILNTQGKAGAVELKDLASELAALTPMFSKFAGGQGVGGMKQLGASLQIVRRNFGSASEAATGLAALMGALTAKSGPLKKAKINVFDKKGNQRSITDIIEDVRRANLKLPKLQKILGSKEALNAMLALKDNYEDFRGLVELPVENSITKDMDQFNDSSAGQMQKSLNDIKLAVAAAFTPERIKAFAEALAEVAGLITTISDFAEDLGDFIAFRDTNVLDVPQTDQRRKDLHDGMTALANEQGPAAVMQRFDQAESARKVAFETSPAGIAQRRQQDLEQNDPAEAARQFVARERQQARDQAELRKKTFDEAHERRENYRRNTGQPPIVVKSTLVVDGNAIATASGEATKHRKHTAR